MRQCVVVDGAIRQSVLIEEVAEDCGDVLTGHWIGLKQRNERLSRAQLDIRRTG